MRDKANEVCVHCTEQRPAADRPVMRNKKFKVMTDSNHSFNIAPNLLDRDFSAEQPNQKWAGVSAVFGHAKAGST